MNFSMDGFRNQLSRDVEHLRDLVKDAINLELNDSQELVDAMNAVIQQSNIVNCVYNPDDSSFTDLSDKLCIDSIEINSEYMAVICE